MKLRILLTVVAASLLSNLAVAAPVKVPDAGGTAGALVLGLVTVVALCRKSVKK